jgi:hypothetical protein
MQFAAADVMDVILSVQMIGLLSKCAATSLVPVSSCTHWSGSGLEPLTY